jgi:hypothetical protein
MNNSNKHSKHTPGPWAVVHATATGESIRIRDLEHRKGYLGAFEATVIGDHGPLNWKNARLIAAAPEMLEALEKLREALWHLGGSEDAIEVCETAIAKARGES